MERVQREKEGRSHCNSVESKGERGNRVKRGFRVILLGVQAQQP